MSAGSKLADGALAWVVDRNLTGTTTLQSVRKLHIFLTGELPCND